MPAEYVEVAIQLLDLSTHRPEGDTSTEEIERELIADAEQRARPVERDPADAILRPAAPRDPRRIVLAGFAFAIIGWMVLQAMRMLWR